MHCCFAFPVSAAPTEADAANSLYALGLVQGYANTSDRFGLADNLTRAQAVILLERLSRRLSMERGKSRDGEGTV